MENESKYAFKLIILILVLLEPVQNQNTTLTYGINLLLNPDFELPAMISPNLSTTYDSSILGWNCTRSCQLYNLKEECLQNFTFFCPLSIYHQVMNLQSSGIQNVTQIIILDANITNYSYRLQFQWLPPQIFPLSGKYVTVYFNSIPLVNITINISNCFSLSFFKYSTTVTVETGINQIRFAMGGSSDGFGIFIDNVSLQEIIIKQNTAPNSPQIPSANSSGLSGTYSSDSIASTIFFSLTSNSYNKILNQLPGSRVFCSYLMNFYIDFDRLQFYYFHKQNFTQNAQIFLKTIKTLQDNRGGLVQLIILSYSNQSYIAKSIQNIDSRLRQILGFKYNYSNQFFLSRHQNGDGFIENQLRFFYYQLPCILLLQMVLFMLFHLLFSYKVSVNFRKYCFFGILLLLLFQGNVEQFTFYILTELKCLFSATLTHKLVNSFIIGFGFLLCFYIFGSLLYFYSYYQKYSKYFIEDCQRILCSFISVMTQSGVVPFASGAIHSLILESLSASTILLVLMEISWIVLRIYFLKKRIYLYRIRVFIHIFNNLLRIVFLVSLYCFSVGGSAITINGVHFYFISGYVASWIFQITVTFFLICSKVFSFTKSLCIGNKIRNVNESCLKSGKSKASKQTLVSFQVINSRFKVKRCVQIEDFSKNQTEIQEHFTTNTLKSRTHLKKQPFSLRFFKNKVLSLIQE